MLMLGAHSQLTTEEKQRIKDDGVDKCLRDKAWIASIADRTGTYIEYEVSSLHVWCLGTCTMHGKGWHKKEC